MAEPHHRGRVSIKGDVDMVNKQEKQAEYLWELFKKKQLNMRSKESEKHRRMHHPAKGVDAKHHKGLINNERKIMPKTRPNTSAAKHD